MIRIALAVGAVLALTTPALADPILTPIFASILSAASLTSAAGTATVLGFTINVAAVLASITMTAIGVGLTMLLAKTPKAPAAEDGQVPIQQPVPFRTFAYGTVRVSGAVLLHENIGGWYSKVHALVGHKISSITSIYLNDDAVTLTTSSSWGVPVGISGPLRGHVVTGAGNRYYTPHIIMDTRLGEATQGHFEFISNISVQGGTAGSAGIWTANHRGDGIALLAMTCRTPEQQKYNAVYPYGPPVPSAKIDAALVFDPRDAAQSASSEATFAFSRNPVLQLLHFFCFSPFGPQRDFADVTKATLANWIRAANDCDAFVPRKGGGTERRYQAGAFFSAEQDRKVIIQTLLAAFDGWICMRGDGSIDIDAGVYREPELVITDADIIGFRLLSDKPSRERANSSKARWTSPDHDYVTVETDARDDYEDQARRPGPPNVAVLDLVAVQSVGQASRLHKREETRQKSRTTGMLMLRWSALDVAFSRRVRVQSNVVPRLANAVIEIREPNISFMEQKVTVNFLAVGAEIDSYDPAGDESSLPPIPSRPENAALEAPDNIDAQAVQMTDAGGISSIVVEVTWDDPFNGVVTPPFRQYVVRWRDAGASGAWIQIEFSDLTPIAGVYTVRTGVVPSDTTVEIAVAARSYSIISDWSSPPIEVDTSVSSVAPSPPTDLVAPNGTGTITLSAKMPNSSNATALQFYRAASGAGFGSAVAVGTPVYGAPSATLTKNDSPTPGTYDYFVVALNAYSVASSAVGPDSATIS